MNTSMNKMGRNNIGRNKVGRHISAGFTLVELLLAMTLMSILLALTYSGLRAASRSADQGEKMLAAGGEVRAAHQFVRRQLNQMLPLSYTVSDDIDQTRVVFEGDARRIQYVAPMPGYLGAGGPQVQMLELVNGDNGQVLQISHALLQEYEEGDLGLRDPVTLLEHIQSATFEFLGRDEKGEITSWSASWGTPEILPVAVRLNIGFDEETRLEWPQLVAGVRLDAAAVGGAVQRDDYSQTIQDMIKSSGQGTRNPRD